MEVQKVDNIIVSFAKYFPGEALPSIREQLLQADDEAYQRILISSFKDPQTAIIISVLAGSLGIDRFFIGDTALGIIKLLTCGGFGIWAIIDWFLIMNAARTKNLEHLQQIL